MLIVIVITAAIYVADFAYADFIYPNTFVADVSVGMMTSDDALEEVKTTLEEFITEPVVIVHEGETFEFQPEDLGIGYDYEMIENSLPTLWNKKGVLNGLIKLFTEEQIDPAITINEEQLLNAISILYTEATPQNAYIYLDTENDEIVISPKQNGQTLDTGTLIANIENHFANLETTAITLPLDTLYPQIVEADLEPYTDMAKEVFNNPITIYYEEYEWLFSPNEYADSIIFETKDTIEIEGNEIEITWGQEADPQSAKSNELINQTPKITIAEETISQFADEQIVPEIETAAQDVIITMDENDNITFEGSAKDGLTVDKAALRTSLQLAMENSITALEATTKVIKGGVSVPEELEEKGITQLISTGYTNFYGSPYNRKLNISVGMSKFNGVLVAPDETFSFLDTLGQVDASTGYYKELVIKDNETKPEYGGGLCQVSSTMFRAILYGGLPIVTRTEHSYAVSYYAYPNGYGLDATIYQPWPDLQFTNDTGNYILIQAYSDGNDAYFKFYGTDDDRTVTMDGPYYSSYVSPPADVLIYTTELEPGVTQKEDSAHTGFDVDWYRTIISADGTETTENIYSHYQAWPAKYLVGISEEEYTEMEEETAD